MACDVGPPGRIFECPEDGARRPEPPGSSSLRHYTLLVAYKKRSPAAIIRNAKIWNIILLLSFFRT